MAGKSTQIGWYTLKEDTVFSNAFECAAWYEDVLVKAGKYPVVVYDFRVIQHDNPDFNRRVEGHIGTASVHMSGTIVSDEFGTRFFGVPIGDYDNRKNAGNEAAHNMMSYMYSIAESVLKDPESPWELLPEYEARSIQGEWGGEPYTVYGIYRKV